MDRGTLRWYQWWPEAVGAVLVLAVRLATLPKTFWENDEFLFAEGVRNFDPSRYHPHPPGYPLYILLGKLFNAVLHDPFVSLVAMSVISSVVTFLALAYAFRQYLGDRDLAIAGALLLSVSAAMLVHGPLPMSDPPSLAFLALALAAMTGIHNAEHDERAAIFTGLWCSAAIGVRPQLAIPVLPMLLVALAQMRTWRQRIAAVGAFAFLSLMWLLPLMDAAGGWSALVAYETKQAAYFAAHDAAMSRGAMSTPAIVTRFVAHPWGSKYITIPLILCLAVAALSYAAGRRRAKSPPLQVLLPLIVFTVVQLIFELATMDPADAARYSLPAMIFISLVAAAGFGVIRDSARIRAIPFIAVAFFGIGSWLYVAPILRVRGTRPSPVAEAAAFAKANFAKNTVILYDLSLRPHAEYLMSGFKTMAIEPGLRALYDQPNIPIVFFADGGSKAADAHVFAWPPSDAYGKLTRNHYRLVTLDPIRAEERYLPERGVYALEKTIEGDEWRWLAPEATIRLPHAHGRNATLTFRLSHDAPYDTNDVTLFVNGVEAGKVTARKDGDEMVAVALPQDPNVEIRIVSRQQFRPDTVLHNQDPRLLAVQLTGVVQSP